MQYPEKETRAVYVLIDRGIMSIEGIDVSHNNGKPDWAKVAAAEKVFAYAKATEGLKFKDPEFVKNWAAIKHASMKRGAYHFFHPLSKPEDQADHFCTVVGSLGPGDLPPAVDLEWTKPDPDEWPRVPRAGRVGLVVRCLQRVEQRLGIRPIVYSSKVWVEEFIPGAAALAAYGLWVADFKSKDKPLIPPAWKQWLFWQHTDKGSVAGITGEVDLDRFNGTLADLETISKRAAAPAPPT
jgi:lysozyme